MAGTYKYEEYLFNDAYIYFYHVPDKDTEMDAYENIVYKDGFLYLPTYPDTIQDNMGSTFQQTNALSRSAPVWTFSYSGPRTVNVQLSLFRDVVDMANESNPNALPRETGEDYADSLIRHLQSIALPRYQSGSKGVVPPMIAMRMGSEVAIKGVVNGGVQVGFSKPILSMVNMLK